MNITLKEIAELTSGELEGDAAKTITGAAGLADAVETDVSFLGNPKYGAQAAASKAGCLLLPKSAKGIAGVSANRIYVEDAQWAFAQVLDIIEKELLKPVPPAIDQRTQIHHEARLSPNLTIGPFTVIDRRAIIGEGTVIGPQCFIGFNSRIGKNCRIYPQVTIRENVVLGDRCVVHSGTVIGADGFGFSTDRKTGAHRKIPQIGKVVIEDDVEIGSNVSIDRATVGVTKIGAGTKIDNLVQIAHNVHVGRNCLIVSQVGIAGSTKVGDQVILGGQVGVVGHVNIGDGAILTAQTGVMSDIEPKSVMFGSPARPHREAMKLQALINKLPEIYEAVKSFRGKQKPEPEGDHAKTA
ncbi:MAG: UDP-3-O-(3-hydroxymyristoyl)glucosamine N-acyltransferase [Elusimicrobia bacterium]|nr:UDP-3-O-(3-hydroxymyristoyl)glucosamine N-acyltransferase [Elusimicrobiota bacterium]